MKLTALQIQQLPGMQPVTINDFGPSVTFIMGPNAIGKSSLIRALQALLVHPDSATSRAIAATAEFEQEGRIWRVERTGSTIHWTLDGELGAPPPLPSPEVLHCYWLSAESLLVPADADHEELQRRLRQALAGGIDPGAVRKTANLEPVAFPQGYLTERDSARTQRQQQEDAYRRLEAERNRLPEQREALAAARAARDTVQAVEAALELADAHADERRCRAHLDAFPGAIRDLRGDEAEQAAERLAELTAAEARCASATATLTEVDTALANTGLADNRPDAATIEGLREVLQELRQSEQAAATHHSALQEAMAREAEVLADLGGTADEPINVETAPRLTPGVIEDIEVALERRAEAQGRADRLESDQQPAGATGRLRGFTLIPLAGGVLAAIGGLAPLNVLALGGGVLAAVGAAVLLWQVWQGQNRTNGDDAGTQARQEAAAAASACTQLLTQHGISPDRLEGAGIGRLLRIARRLDEAKDARAAAAGKHTAQLAACEQWREQLAEPLCRWTSLTPEAVADGALPRLQAAIEDLATRCEHARDLIRQRAAAANERQAAEAQHSQVRKAYEALFTGLGLAVGDQRGLEASMQQHAQWQAASDAHQEAQLRIDERRRLLDSQPTLIEQAERLETTALEAQKAELQARAEQVDTLQAAIADLEAKLSHAGGDGALANALAHEQQLDEQLDDRLEAHLRQRLGDWLLEDIESAYQSRNEPALLEDARARFERFTHHAWSVVIHDGHALRARDLATGANRSLADLSAGTRMQLLLAARIAWARDQETEGWALPLVLDDALGATDPERFRAVANNLQQLALEESRQLLYLTPRPEELSLWQSVTEQTPTIIDLSARLREQAFTRPIQPAAAPPVIPPPGDRSAADYGALLQVPAIDLQEPPGSIHLFHLLRDQLEALHTLLAHWNIARLGPAERWLASPAARALGREVAWPAMLERRILIARHWMELARQGRGRPLAVDTIAASDTQSQTMAERISAVARDCDNDARRLIAALRAGEVRHLRAHLIKNLEQWLVDEGYIDERPVLDAEVIRLELLGRLGHTCDPGEIALLSDWLTQASPHGQNNNNIDSER